MSKSDLWIDKEFIIIQGWLNASKNPKKGGKLLNIG